MRPKIDKTAPDHFDGNDRRNNPTFCGFLKEQMSPLKESVQMKPAVINKQQTIPGGYGWGVASPVLHVNHKMITDDH